MIVEELAPVLERFGFRRGVDLFLNGLPPQPDQAIGLREYGGSPASRTLRGLPGGMIHPRVQVLSRSSIERLAGDRLWIIHHALEAIRNERLGARLYQSIGAVSTPGFLEVDENNRPVWVCNFEVSCSTGVTI